MTATALKTATSSRAVSDSWRPGLLAVMALALVVRGAVVIADRHAGLFGDPVDYERWAVSIVTGHGFPVTEVASQGTPSAYRPPAYPLLLAGLYGLTGIHLTAARVLGALLGAVTAGLTATLGRALWSPRVGVIAGVLAAVFPPLVALNGTLVSESLFLPLELGFVLALLAAWRSPARVGWAACAGVLCAGATLTRAVALPWVIILVVVSLTGRGRVARRRRLLATAAAVLAWAAVLAPWTIRNAEVLHVLVPVSTEEGFNLAGQYNATVAAPGTWQSVWQVPLTIPELAREVRPLLSRPGGASEAQLDTRLRTIAIDYARGHPGDVLRAIGNDTLRLFDLGPGHTAQTGVIDSELETPPWLRGTLHLAGLAAGVLALAGLAVSIRRRQLGPWWLWALPALVWLITVPALGNPLKRAPIDPFLILLAAVAVDAAAGLIGRSRRGGGSASRRE